MAYHITGWKRMPHDPRDRKFRTSPRFAATLPRRFSLLDEAFGKVPLNDQGNLGSCGPNSANECIYDDEVADAASPIITPSRLFIYYTTRLLMGTVNEDSGVDNRSMGKALQQYGFCEESMWPYTDDPLTFRQRPPAACFAVAIQNRILGYSFVDVSLDAIKSALYVTRRPVVFGFDVFKGLLSNQAEETGVVPDPKPGETPLGGHDVSVYGYDDDRQWLMFRNHWKRSDGSPWGDKGNGYMSYRQGTNRAHVSDLTLLDAVAPKPIPPGPLPPVPPPTPNPVADRVLQAELTYVSGLKQILTA